MGGITESKKTNTAKEPTANGPKLTWAQRLAEMDPGEAAALRAKANEASKRSKARKRGMTPATAKVQRLEAQLEKLTGQQTELNAKRQQAEEELEEARAERKAEVAAAKAKAVKEAAAAEGDGDGEAS